MKKKYVFASVLTIALSISSAAFAAKPTEQDKADAAKINAACVSDAKTAGCSGLVVGKGLLKCLHKYKKGNPSFKLSEDCHAAIKDLKEDKDEGK